MKIKLVLLLLLLFSVTEAFATHIVGGQLFITENKGSYYNYKIGLTMYFDAINGNPGAEDQAVYIYIFRKRDNQLLDRLEVPKIGRNLVNYTNPSCVISSAKTIEVTYALDVQVLTAQLNDPAGYYMVWDRCCRNGTISNIKDPGDAGSLFYLEFPALHQNNREFFNSSPVFPKIQGDYACVNTPFNFDFGGTDADGDSLVYSLTTPMQGYSTKATPSVAPSGSSNYPKLNFVDGISVSNMIPGPKPLSVNSKTGMLSVTPGNTGLYVFAVQVDEYRNKKKIGSVTRDFQLQVVDCPKMTAPTLFFKPKGQNTFYTHNQIYTVKKDDPNCFEVMVVDPSVNDIVKVDGWAVNNDKNYFSLLPTQFNTTVSNDTMRFQVCLEECFVSYGNRPIRIDLIASDGSCPAPLTDTLTIYIKREGGSNTPPQLTTSLSGDIVKVAVGTPVKFTVFGKDTDKDDLELSASGEDFTLQSQSMDFKAVSGNAAVQQNFTWTPPCNARLGDTLVVNFLLEDMRCSGNPLPVTKPIYFIVESSPNTPPAVLTNLPRADLLYTIGQSSTIAFDVLASDPDTNTITLSAVGKGFNLKDLGMLFSDKSGTKKLQSPYSWSPVCEIMKGEKEKVFEIDFITTDKTCQSASDTTTVSITVIDEDSFTFPEIPNVITPNQDGKNDCLILDNLPYGNCENQFKQIVIYNRWGKQVYQTNQIGQNWCPSDITAGYYFYMIEYSNKSYKGGVTVIK